MPMRRGASRLILAGLVSTLSILSQTQAHPQTITWQPADRSVKEPAGGIPPNPAAAATANFAWI